MTWSMRSKLDPLASVSQTKRHLHRLELFLNVSEIRCKCFLPNGGKKRWGHSSSREKVGLISPKCHQFIHNGYIYVSISRFSMCIDGSTEVFLLISVLYACQRPPLSICHLNFIPLSPQPCLSKFSLNVTTAPWVKCLNRFRIWTICSHIEPQLAWCSPLSAPPSAMNTDSRGLHTDKSHRHTALTGGKPIAHFASYYHLWNTLKDISNCIARTVYSLSPAGWWCCFCNQVAKQQQQQRVPHIRNIGF